MAWALLAVVATLAAAPARAAQNDSRSPSIAVTAHAGELRIALRGSPAATLDVETLDDGLLVTFPAPFDGARLDGITLRHPGWFRDLRYGYDTLFIAPAPGVRFNARDDVDGMVLAFTRNRAPAAARAQRVDDGSALRLARLDGVVRHRLGDSLGGRAILRTLMHEHPADVQTRVDLIEIENHLGRWERSLALYDHALALSPGASFLVAGQAALRREHGPFIRFDMSRTAVDEADEQLKSVLDTRAFVAGGTVLGARMEHRFVDTPGVVNPRTGLVAPFHRQRGRASAYVERGDIGPGRLRLTLSGARSVVGAGLDYELGTNYGRSRLAVRWHTPEWEFVEGVVHAGWRDRVHLRHAFHPYGAWSVQLGAGFNRFGLDREGKLARSFELQADARFIVRRAEPAVTIAYGLDSERYGGVVRRRDQQGNLFAPIGFTDSEVHRLELNVFERVSDYLLLSAAAGYSVDRLQQRGPFWRADLAYEPWPGLEMGLALAFTKSSSTGSGGTSMDQRAFVKWRF